MDWNQCGWRWLVEGGRYEIEGPGMYSKTYDVYWLPTEGRVVSVDAPYDDDGERPEFRTLEAAQGACKAHYNERRAHPIVRLVGSK